MILKRLNGPLLFWIGLFFIYILFITTLSALYPFGGDEYYYTPNSLSDIISKYIINYYIITPKIGSLFNLTVLFIGKWFFVCINPFLQLLLNILIFFTVFLRLPNLKTLNDLPAFFLLLLLTSFACAQPDNVLFWIGGTTTYTYPFILFTAVLIFFRLNIEGKYIKNNIKYAPLILPAAFFILGMSSEVLGPMTLILLVYVLIYCKKTFGLIPCWAKYAVFAIVIGITVFFIAPGSYKRLNSPFYSYFRHLPMHAKMLNHIPLMIKTYIQQWCLLPLSVLMLLLYAFKNKIRNNKDFNFALIMIISSLLCSSALFLAPFTNQRPFYHSSMFAIVAFMISLKLIANLYGKYIFRLFLYPALIFSVVILPLFIIPFYNLYHQDIQRYLIIQKAVKKHREKIYISPLISMKGPYDNLTIYFYDSPSNINTYDIEIYSAENRPKDRMHIKQY